MACITTSHFVVHVEQQMTGDYQSSSVVLLDVLSIVSSYMMVSLSAESYYCVMETPRTLWLL